jgi:hypothetical protein
VDFQDFSDEKFQSGDKTGLEEYIKSPKTGDFSVGATVNPAGFVPAFLFG